MRHPRPLLQPEPVDGPLCRNCGARAEHAWCPVCGQETKVGLPSVSEFVAEFLRENLAIQGQLARTLFALLLKPGRLTLEYVHGRRRRYVRPLRLYLGLSLVFFAVLGTIGDGGGTLIDIDSRPAGSAAGAASDAGSDTEAVPSPAPSLPPAASPAGSAAVPPTAAAADPAAAAPPAAPADADGSSGRGDDDRIVVNTGHAAFDARLQARVDAFFALPPEQRTRRFSEAFIRWAPVAMFFLMPMFALLLRIGYLLRGAPYALHLLFSINAHSFVFALLLVSRLPWPAPLDDLLLLAAPVYLWRALLVVHGGSGAWTALFALLLLVVYAIVLAIGMTLATVLPMALL